MTRPLPIARLRARVASLALALALATGLSAAAPVVAEDDPAAGLPAPAVTVDVPCTAPATEEGIGDAYETTAAAGETILLRLCVQPGTGFRWSDALSTNEAAVTIRDWTFMGPTDDTPGAPGTEEILLFAEGPGTASIVTAYARPWVGSTDAPRMVVLAVTVTGDPFIAASAAPERTAAGKQARIQVVEGAGRLAVVGPPVTDIPPGGSFGPFTQESFRVVWAYGTGVITVVNQADGLRVTARMWNGSVWEHRFTGDGERVVFPYQKGSIEFVAESLQSDPLLTLTLR